MNREKPQLVAEIACNHQGKLDLACRCIEQAAKSGADFIKFQKRSIANYSKFHEIPHPNPEHSFGRSYYEHRRVLEFSIEQHYLLKKVCEDNGVQYAVSVWDLESLREFRNFGLTYVKIPSAENANLSLLREAIDQSLPIHLSLGMTSQSEKEAILNYLREQNYFSRSVIYVCTSSYPTRVGDLYLSEILFWMAKFPGIQMGFSGHYLDTNLDNVAYALGACWIERHFTLDRSMKGTDQALSLLPEEFARVKQNLLDAYSALQARPEQILESEQEAWMKLKNANTRGSLSQISL